jgi:hypothetical protein
MIATTVGVLTEPTLEFRYGQSVEDPRLGLAIFGPYDADRPGRAASISFGAIGTKAGLRALTPFVAVLAGPVPGPSEADRRLWPAFPGFDAAFSSSLPVQATRKWEVDASELDGGVRLADESRRVSRVVELYLDGLKAFRRSDDKIDVVFCVIPDIVYTNCRPLSRVRDAIGQRPTLAQRRAREGGQLDLWDEVDPDIYLYSTDFRRQLKARAMEYELPIQILRESTLRLDDPATFGERGLTPLSDRAWNIGTALYYKAGGKPWRLNGAREGVCYIGLAYKKRDADRRSPTAACAAQMFLDSGDGVVFLGEFGPWYSPERRQCHLPAAAATRMLEGVLQTYQTLDGRPLRELFIHCRSGIDDEEFAGFQAACPPGIKLVGIRVATERGVRLFREGRYPVARGTCWRLTDRKALLWASGYKPSIETYDGWETPRPLLIEVQHGDASIDQVAEDIYALTKLNYNACRLGDSEPVTVGFSGEVGEILVSNPTVARRHPQFKFYI